MRQLCATYFCTIPFLVLSCSNGETTEISDEITETSPLPQFECGRSAVKRTNTKIVGGSEAQPGLYPWMALVYFEEETEDGLILQAQCGGALISPKHVLTARHCIGYEEVQAYAHLGVHNATEANPEIPANGTIFTKITRFITYDDLVQDNDFQAHDIAIAELEETVSYTKRIRPICLPSKDQELKDGLIAGWGSTLRRAPWDPSLVKQVRTVPKTKKVGYPDSDVLMHVRVPILDEENCEKYPFFNNTVEICAGFLEGGKDSCQGDSGGPLIVENEGISTVVGVVSYGAGCAHEGFPGIYSRVSYYQQWIRNVTGIL